MRADIAREYGETWVKRTVAKNGYPKSVVLRGIVAGHIKPDMQNDSIMRTVPIVMTDAELCELLHIKPHTMRKLLREGPSRKRTAEESDIRLIQKIVVGGKRLWSRESVESFVKGKIE